MVTVERLTAMADGGMDGNRVTGRARGECR